MNNKIYSVKFSLIIFILILGNLLFAGDKHDRELAVHFKGDSKIEVGSAYAGLEFHHSSILPQRISFYYPVANSIDLSTDYWRRDTTYVMRAGLKIGNGSKHWLGDEKFEYDLMPHTVSFVKTDKQKSVNVTYEFCKNKPAMVITYVLTNRSDKKEEFEFYTHLETSLKTCHTYALKDTAVTEFDNSGNTIYSDFNDGGTQYAQVFAANSGLVPSSYNTKGNLNSSSAPDNDYWFTHDGALPGSILTKENPGIPAAEFVYKQELLPGGKMTIVQIVGSCRQEEGRDMVKYLLGNYKQEVKDYEDFVIGKSFTESNWNTGDKSIDHSAQWAKAILAANQHYIDGEIAPMPCPAEYNFYFAHDVLLTDLAAVNFDLPRVKRDLKFIAEHSDSNKVIPHAYYWKDSAFVTEFASSDNWNNFWFIITSASYLRHSGDKELLKYLYPYLSQSIKNAMKTKKDDNVMWSYRPDWWDIGSNFGPRAYMTILFSKALKDFNFISFELGEKTEVLAANDKLANKMGAQVVNKFWDNEKKYLMNYLNDGSEDPHYYIGSLMAINYDLLDKEHTTELLQTTKNVLLDKKLGVYTAFPMDFTNYEKILGFSDEVGMKYYYFNGGIWPQDNAWYALALSKNGMRQEALDFVKTTMTLEGITNGPNGQPAMYEVRIPNKDDSSLYGSVDKPQFMWAGGWYLYTLYHLYGIDENDWNISFSPFLASGQKACAFSLCASGKTLQVKISGKGKYIKSIKYDGKSISTAVIPENLNNTKDVDIVLGNPETPYVSETNSKVVNSTYNKESKKINIELNSFTGHTTVTKIISPKKPKTVNIDGNKVMTSLVIEKKDNNFIIILNSKQTAGKELIDIEF
ncbi:MAG: hypothetical protein P4L45_04570 [Ignavibacteriaceae bacterium]|nr:hypothetical protein [Ignavibacteriaceae bacterium]